MLDQFERLKTMKIKNLIKKLQKLNPEAIVILSSDSEGNFFSELKDISDEMKVGNVDSYELEIYNNMSVEDREITQKEFDKLKDCVILWP